jgi:hypothetical protein
MRREDTQPVCSFDAAVQSERRLRLPAAIDVGEIGPLCRGTVASWHSLSTAPPRLTITAHTVPQLIAPWNTAVTQGNPGGTCSSKPKPMPTALM